MPTHAECRRLADQYLQDAEALFTAGRYNGSAYLCGYVLEFALKARICRHLKLRDYPPPKLSASFKTHNYDELRLLGGLDNWPGIKDPRLYANWCIVAGWKPDWRYEPPGFKTKADVEAILKALTDKSSGILTWLKKHW